MSAAATPITITASPLGPERRPGFGALLASEWTKFRSVRSTIWSLIVAVILVIGLGALFCGLTAANWNNIGPEERLRFNGADHALRGLYLGQLAIVVLGIMVITGEYATGMIRTSLTARPDRNNVLAAKAVVFATVALVVGEIVSFVSFFLGQALLGSAHEPSHIGDPGVLRAVVGGGLYLTVLGLLGLGLGAILRHTAAAITTAMALLLVLPLLANALPQSWQDHIDKFLPFNAGAQIFTVRPDVDVLSPWAGFGVFCIYAAVALLAGFFVLNRRDA